MAQLLGIRIRNYRSLRDVTLGQTGYGEGVPLPHLVCLIGANGCGKSTVLDAFGFLADCLRDGVEAACDRPHRGGFERLRTQGSTEPISFALYYREATNARPITYELDFDLEDGRPIVARELLKQRRKKQKRGRPFPFLRLERGVGEAWSGEATEGEETANRVEVNLDDMTRLGITTLGQLREHPRILGLRAYIEGWYLSYFVPDDMRTLQVAGAQRHLDREGKNVSNYLQHLQRSHPDHLQRALDEVSRKIPGVKRIGCETSQDRRLLIRFEMEGYAQPFYQADMSDGTLKLFAYMLLLEDPEPQPLIGIEEPENGLYHQLLYGLAREFFERAEDDRHTQVFVTTHSPAFVDALGPDNVWVLRKRSEGDVSAECCGASAEIRALVEEGIPLGSLWFSRHLEADVAGTQSRGESASR
ncbi:MAG: hypothetical protein RIT45_1749 [Pseudomonadota bacterium]